MANRYWVGGTASWDGTAGTKWATQSNGAGGASVPTSADDVFFDSASGAVTVTIASGNTGAKSINCTGFTGTLTGSFPITVSGSITLVAGMTFSYSASITINGTGTLTTAGKIIQGSPTINGSGITVTLGDALNITGALFTINQGTFDTAGYSLTCSSLQIAGSNPIVINLNNSTVTLTGNGGVFANTATNLTFNAGTSTIVHTGTGSASFEGGNATFYNVSFTTTNGQPISFTGVNTFNNLSITGPASIGIRQITFSARQTINGTLSTTNTAGNRRVWFSSATYGLAQTITVNSMPSLTDCDFRDIYVVGTAAPISGTRIGNLRGCSGITFSTPKTVYWNLSGNQNWTSNGWAPNSGGTPSVDNFPLAQDTAIVNNSSQGTGITLDTFVPYIGTLDMSGRTTAMTITTFTNTAVYGDWITGSGITVAGSQTLTFSGRTTQTITSAGKTFSCAITVDSYGGTVELADALNIGTNGLTVTNGTFDTKNFNVTAGSLSSSNSNVRTINLGSSTITLSNIVNFTTFTNITVNSGTSTITHTAASPSPNFGTGLTFYNLSFTGTSGSSTSLGGTSFTCNNLTVTAPSAAGIQIVSCAASSITVTGTLTVAGASPVRRIFLRSDTFGTPRTLTVGTLSATDCDFRDITIAGTAAGSSPTRAGDCGGNSGITFPAAKTVYWNLSGAQNWSATAWAPGTGGTPDINNFPLAQDTAVFDNAGSAGTVTINTSWNIGTLDMSNRTSAMTLSVGANSPYVYGDWKWGTGVTSSTDTGELNFGKNGGVQKITSNGISFNCNLSIRCFNSTTELTDAFSISSNKIFSIINGTFDAKTYNVTVPTLGSSVSTTRTLKMGSGTWTITANGNCWLIGGTNITFYKGTANILLSDTSTIARTFDGGGLSYNKLTIGGTTGTSTTTINGNNQFTELASTKTVAHTIALGTLAQTFGKWTVTGTAGNVVTLTGTGTSNIIAGPATSGIDYLAMGSIGFSSTSPGEFYAGANSTGTAGAPVYRTAAPAARTLYWVGGTGNWSDTARWSTTSGSGSGAAVPTSLDNVVFNSGSNATAYTSTIDGTYRFKSLTISGPASGNLTLSATSRTIIAHGSVSFPATGLTTSFSSSTLILSGDSTSKTLSNPLNFSGLVITVNGVEANWVLGTNIGFSGTSNTLTLTTGTLDLATYNLSCGTLTSTGSFDRTLSLGTGTATISTGLNLGTAGQSSITFTLNKGTSKISYGGTTFGGNSKTFYDVEFTTTSGNQLSITGNNSFNNLTINGRSSGVIRSLLFQADQTISGTLTLPAGTDPSGRNLIQSANNDTTITLTCNAVSLADVDFRNITIAGAAAPASGTRLGDGKGNNGITFTAAKTVYWNLAAGGNWSSAAWALQSNGTASVNNFPLAQDTVIIENTGLTTNNNISVNATYLIGTINMNNRTNSMTLTIGANGTTIFGDWTLGTGVTLSGTSTVTFAGRYAQNLTTLGKSFPFILSLDSPSGSLVLQDAFNCTNTGTNSIQVVRGTFNSNTYNVTTTGGVNVTNTTVRGIDIGSGTWTVANAWSAATATNLTISGTGTIKMTGASAKNFDGGGISYSNITLDQGGAGALTISGNNTFKDITNTYKATGATTINFGSTTQRVSQFTASGESNRALTLTGTSAASPATLVLSSGTSTNDYLTISNIRAYPVTSAWTAGANSINNGTQGWTFEQAAAPVTILNGNFLMFLGR